MKMRKLLAAFLSAATIAASAVPAYAEKTEAVISVDYNASETKWNGKTAMKEGGKYYISSDVTVSSAVEIPKKATLTVKKGGKLTISQKGSLKINGTLSIANKASLIVSGKLTLNKGYTLSVNGTMKFGSKATATLNGKFTLKSSGTVSGTPKKITVGNDSVMKLGGKNKCSKLTAAVEKMFDSVKTASAKKVSAKTAKKEISALYNKMFDMLFTYDNYYQALCMVSSDYDVDYYLKDLKTIKADPYVFCYDNADILLDECARIYTLGNITKREDIKSITVKLDKFVDITSGTTGELNSLYKQRFGDFSQVWASEATYTINLQNGKKHTISDVLIGFVYSGGKIYLTGEVYNDAVYKKS